MKSASEASSIALPVRLFVRFGSAAFEQRFLAFYEAFYHRYAQVGLCLGILLILADYAVDHLMYPQVGANAYRLSVSVPLLGGGLLLSLTALGKAYWQALMALTLLLVGISLYWILAQIGAQGGSGLGSWVGVLNYTFFEFYCFVILGLSFRYAFPTGLLLFAAFEVAIYLCLDDGAYQANYLTYHVFTVFVLAAMVGWWREYLLRKEFLALAELEVATQVAQTQAVYLQAHDALTGLPNHAGFSALVEQSMGEASAQHRPLPVLLLDLGRLRRASEAVTQKAADQLMLTLVQRLQAASIGMEPQPTFARISSFELAVLIRHADDTGAMIESAERFLETLAQPLELQAQTFHLQPTGGLALFPQDGPSVDALLKAARVALSMHGHEGRSLHFYDAQRDLALTQRLQLEEDLQQAMAKGQFTLVYQPLVRLSDQVAVGVEALLRWNHPAHGRVEASEFVPILEELGLISEVGEWALGLACQQVVQWIQAGRRVSELAVNVSGLQLADPLFASKVAKALRRSGLPAHCLVLELTESVLVHDDAGALAQLQALKALGLRLALDDFGTGFSSMVSVTRMPFDVLKVDRSFVQSAPTQIASAAIVEAIIALAARLGMQTVAEGIEDPQQLQFLQNLGCPLAQGYWFAKPCEAVQAEVFLATAGRV